MIKKSVLSGALPLVLLAPPATVLSCATSAPQQKDDATVLAELKDRLNQTPPQWKSGYENITKNDFDQMSRSDRHDLLLDRLELEVDPAISVNVMGYNTEANPTATGGTITYRLKLTLNQAVVETNEFNLNYTLVLPQSQLLADQRKAFTSGIGNHKIILRSDLPPFERSSAVFYRKIALTPGLNFEKWQPTFFESFIETIPGLTVQIRDFSIDLSAAKLSLEINYHDPVAKENWTPPTLKLPGIKASDEIKPEANQAIIELLYQGQVFKLRDPRPDRDLTAANLLQNTTFDSIKDDWMANEGVDYAVVDFKKTTSEVKFKLKISLANQSLTTTQMVFQL